MEFRIEPAAVSGGNIHVPGDKSISHRALMLGSVALGRTTIKGFLAGEDCLATLAALRAMGVAIDRIDDMHYTIDGVGLHGLAQASSPLDLGNSGTAMRLFAGLLSGQSFSSELVGDASLCQRPMNRVITPLQKMGALIEAKEGRPPLNIAGGQRLDSMRYNMPIASAQVKSAILLAGLYAEGDVTVIEPAVSRDHTERMLEYMGVTLRYGDGQVTMPGGQQPRAQLVEVPADLSSATFAILATVISANGDTTISGVGINPTRTGVIDILRSMGARIDIENERMLGMEPVADIRARASSLSGVELEPSLVSLAIDEFPALFIAAAVASGTTRFSGIGELRVKESDRIAAMAQGLATLGISVQESPDEAVITGGALTSGVVDSQGDHRIAMSFAVAGSVASGPVRVLGTENVVTSFPGFPETMQSIGVSISQDGEEAA